MESHLQEKFGPAIASHVVLNLKELEERGWVHRNVVNHHGVWRLTDDSHIVSNQVFAALTFLKGELDALA
jgi:hypothetical protein